MSGANDGEVRPVVLRRAREADMHFVLAGTRELGVAEGRPGAVTATEGDLWRLLSTPGVAAECVIIERRPDAPGADGSAKTGDPEGVPLPVGHVWFFIHATTFAAQALLYIEDIVVRRAHRGAGLGRSAMSALARLARDRGCAGMHWSVVEGNDDAVRFYLRLGAEAKTGGGQFKIAGDAFDRLAAR